MIAIVAATFDQAQRWASDRGLPRRSFRIITSIDQLVGIDGWEIETVAGWTSRPDWLQIGERIDDLIRSGRASWFGDGGGFEQRRRDAIIALNYSHHPPHRAAAR